MRAMSCSEVSADLAGAMERVVADCTPLAITLERGEGAVLVSASEWASIEETLYLLRSPTNAKRLMDSIANLGRSDVESMTQLAVRQSHYKDD